MGMSREEARRLLDARLSACMMFDDLLGGGELLHFACELGIISPQEEGKLHDALYAW